MADSLVSLYAVGDAVLGEHVRTGLIGVEGTSVRVIVDGRLGAVVSMVGSLHFSEEALQRNLEDLIWLAEAARAHHAVVDAVWQHHLSPHCAPGDGLPRRRQRSCSPPG